MRLIAALLLLIPGLIHAQVRFPGPPTLEALALESLQDPLPFVFDPWEIKAERDLALEFQGGAPAGWSAQWIPLSTEWIRVSEVLVVPRARVRIEAPHGAFESALVIYAGARHAFVLQDGRWQAELPIAAISGPENRVRIEVQGQQTREVSLKWRSAHPVANHVFTDPSCSPFGVRLEADPGAGTGWAYAGCRIIATESAEGSISSLEVYTVWDSPEGARLDTLKLRPSDGPTRIEHGGKSLKVTHSLPPIFHRAGISLGLGPYSYVFETTGVALRTVAPVLTIYASTQLTRDYRLVLFNASAIHRHYFSDLGVYFHMEYARFLDRRMSFNVMLGGHAISFPIQDRARVGFWAPQGFELIYRDLFGKNRNVGVGAFIYPDIREQSYYNLWVRWGSPRYFIEFNYIDWSLRSGASRVHTQSAGLCFGFPIVQFW